MQKLNKIIAVSALGLLLLASVPVLANDATGASGASGSAGATATAAGAHVLGATATGHVNLHTDKSLNKGIAPRSGMTPSLPRAALDATLRQGSAAQGGNAAASSKASD